MFFFEFVSIDDLTFRQKQKKIRVTGTLTLDTQILQRPLCKFEHYTPALLLRESPFANYKVLAIV